MPPSKETLHELKRIFEVVGSAQDSLHRLAIKKDADRQLVMLNQRLLGWWEDMDDYILGIGE